MERALISDLEVVRAGHVARIGIPGMREDVAGRPVRRSVFEVAADGQTAVARGRDPVAVAIEDLRLRLLRADQILGQIARAAPGIPTARCRCRSRLRAAGLLVAGAVYFTCCTF